MAGFGVPVLQIYTSDPSIPGSNPTGYIVTDHNRAPLNISYDTIENSARMANGTMRRYITANKKKIATSWDQVPAAGGYNFTADANLGGAWLKSFYEENIYNPVWIKLTYAEESWRFPNSYTPAQTERVLSTNKTFNRTAQNLATPYSFTIANVAYSAFTSGLATASVTTKVAHNLTIDNAPEIFITGVNQLFNGTWLLDSVPSSSVLVFKYFSGNNASATFKINSYIQSGNSASFNVDSTDFIQNGASIVLSNVKNISGASVGGVWKVTATPSSKTSFTASTTVSQSSQGLYGDATILSSSSYSAAVSNLNASIIGPTVSSDILKVFMTSFTYDIQKRLTVTDLVNMSIEFTEI
jgi:hypothetical protein